MKKFLFGSVLFALIILCFSMCKKDDDDGNISNWEIDVTVDIYEPDVYTIDADVESVIEIEGNTFAAVSDAIIGTLEVQDIAFEGNMVGDTLTLNNFIFQVEYGNILDPDTKKVTLNLKVLINGNNINGTGTVVIEDLQTGDIEYGNITLTGVEI